MHLTLLGLPGANLGHLVAVLEILTIANQMLESLGNPATFTWTIVTPDGRPVSALGITLQPQRAMEDSLSTDLIFTPAFIGRVKEGLVGREAVCAWLRQRHREGVALATSCTGTFLLALAGLLDGRRAATNWLFAPTFRRLFPRVNLDENAVLVHDRGISTTGATSALNHLLVHLVERECGLEIGAKISGLLLVDPSRISQAPYRRGLELPPHGDREIDRVEVWLRGNVEKSVTISELAALAGLGERQFLRRFKAATAKTPVQYLQDLRIEQARHLLESGNVPVSDITSAVGYEDVTTFRRLFHRNIGLSPNEYRRRFGRVAAMTGLTQSLAL